MNDYLITGTTGEWEVVIGLEVHAQITTAKLFSGAATGALGRENQGSCSAHNLDGITC